MLENMDLNKKRWIVLAASCLVNVCIGTGYAWSVFQVALVENSAVIFGATVAASAIALAFTIDISMSPIPMIVGGSLQKRFGPKKIVLCGGTLFSLGLFLSGLISSVTMLYFTFGVLCGFGTAFTYSITIANSVRFFPDRKGMVAGISTAAFGLGSILMPPVIQMLINMNGVLFAFRTLGIAFFIVIVVSAQFISECAPDWKPNGYVPPAAGPMNVGADKRWNQMLADPRFWVMFVVFTLFAAAGLMMIAQSSSMAIAAGGAAAVSVSLIGISNTAGRVIWGAISDRIGRYPALMVMAALLAVSGFALSRFASGYITFITFGMLLATCYGGTMGVYPAMTAECFGMKNNGVNYGIIFIGFALGGFIGPILATSLNASTGSYALSLQIVGYMGCAAFALVILLALMNRAKAKKA